MTRQTFQFFRIASGIASLLALIVLLEGVSRSQDDAVPLPGNVRAVWDLARAWHETTPTRERICINGLWKWQPAEARPTPASPPAAGVTSRFPAAGRASPITCRRIARRSTRIRAGGADG